MRQQTQRAYAADWHDFVSWCGRRGFQVLPATPETVALYLRARADDGLRLSTLRRRLAAIGAKHREALLPSHTADDLIRETLREIARISRAATESRTAITLPELRRLLNALPATLVGIRDHALVSFAFAAAMRRSELVRLDADQLRPTPHGLVVVSKDGIPASPIELAKLETGAYCPVTALARWVAAAELDAGPLFRPVDRHGQVLGRRLTDRAVGLIVARAAEQAGIEPGRISADSLRLGGQAFTTLGISLDDIAERA